MVPQSVWPILEQMLAKNPAQRFPDWQAVLKAFRELSHSRPDEYKVSDMLQISETGIPTAAASTTPTPKQMPTQDPQTLRLATPGRIIVREAPVAPSGSGRKAVFILLALCIIAAAAALYFGAFRHADKSAEVNSRFETVKNLLMAGDFTEAANNFGGIRNDYAAEKHPNTVKALNQAEQAYPLLEKSWKEFHAVIKEVRRLEEEGKLSDARGKLLDARKVVAEVNVGIGLDNAIAKIEGKMEQQFAAIASEADALGTQGKWDEAIKAWESAGEFAIDRNRTAQIQMAIASAENVRKEEEARKKRELYAALMEKARAKLEKGNVDAGSEGESAAASRKSAASVPDDAETRKFAERLEDERAAAVQEGEVGAAPSVENPPSFSVGTYEITNQQFGEFIADGGYQNSAYWPAGWEWKEERKIDSPLFWNDNAFNGPTHPVVGVSWYEASAYCNWLSLKTGGKYRLPTENEWQSAAAGPKGRPWPWGAEETDPPANLRCKMKGGTMPVGSFPEGKSAYGCLDIIGNAAEWCGDGVNCYAKGGSWLSSLDRIEAYSKKTIPPETRSNRIGFRVVMEAKQ
jgi:formylglycine-generating enzyme required for sulfatase activity/predicted negative regulator of RcsB-dependent stress response